MEPKQFTPSEARDYILDCVDLLFWLRLTDIAKSFGVTFDFVHRRADSLGYPCEQPAPSKIGDSLIRYFLEGLLAAHIRCGVVLRIVQRHLQFNGVVVDPPIPFFDTCMKAFRKPAVIQPRPFVETDRIDHKGVSFPFRNRMPVPCRPEIFEVLAGRQLASVRPDVSYPVFPLE